MQPGDRIHEKYEIESTVGTGGMASVFAAKHLQLGHRVAIKVLLPEVRANTDLIARFVRESRAIARMTSDHITRVLDVGTLDDGTPFMVMELLQGEDLAARIERERALPIHVAVDFVRQACEGIAEAHARGIVHRDLKPGNLFLAKRSDESICVKVIDFGISKTIEPFGNHAALTKTSAMMGSPLYMSPEQLRESKSVDARADIWGLGVTLYELIAGVPPYVAASMAELCSVILTTDPPALSRHRADVPPDLEAVVMRCLAKKVEDRFASAAELAEALRPFTEPIAPLSQSVISVPGPTLAMTHSVHARTEHALDVAIATPVTPRRNRPWLGAVAVAGAVGVIALVGFLRFGKQPQLSAAAPEPVAPPSALPATTTLPPERTAEPIASVEAPKPAATASSPVPKAASKTVRSASPAASAKAAPATSTKPASADPLKNLILQ